MVSALFVVLAQTRTQDGTLLVPTSLAAFEKVMAEAGYPVVREGKDGAAYGLTHGKVRAWIGMARTVGDDTKGTKDTYPFFELRVEFAVPKGTDPATVDARARLAGKDGGPRFESHLGDTVSESARVSFSDGLTRKALFETLERFFVEGEAVARALGADYVALPSPNLRRYRLADATRLDRADVVSLRRATRSWGWEDPKTPGYASQGWLFPIQVGGKRLFLRQTVVDGTPQTASIDVARYDDRPAVGDPWRDRLTGAPILPAVVYEADGPHSAVAVQAIPLAFGVPLGELRRRIERFAKAN